MPYIDDPVNTRKVPGAIYSGRLPGVGHGGGAPKAEFSGVPRVARFREYGTFVPPPDPQEGFDHIWVHFRRNQDAQQYDVAYRIDFAVDGVTAGVSPSVTMKKLAAGGGYASLRWGWYLTSAVGGAPHLIYNDYDTLTILPETGMTDPSGTPLGALQITGFASPLPNWSPQYISPTRVVALGSDGKWKVVDITDPSAPVVTHTIQPASANFYEPANGFVDSVNNLHACINRSGQNGLWRANLDTIPSAQTYELSSFDETGRLMAGALGVGPGGTDTLYMSSTQSGKVFRIVRITAGTPSSIGWINAPVSGVQWDGQGTMFTHPTTGLRYFLMNCTTTSNAATRLLYIYEMSNPEAPTLFASICDPNYGAGRIGAEATYGGILKGDKYYFWNGGSAPALYADQGLWVVDLEDMDNIVTTHYTQNTYGVNTSLGITVPGGSVQFWAGLTGVYSA
jgi:hypothetical protein